MPIGHRRRSSTIDFAFIIDRKPLTPPSAPNPDSPWGSNAPIVFCASPPGTPRQYRPAADAHLTPHMAV